MIYSSGKNISHNPNKRNLKKPNVNIGVFIIAVLSLIFFIRVLYVLNDSKERGAFVYVQILNQEMPVVRSQIYDDASYAENKLSVGNVCIKALGLDNITYEGIIKNEIGALSMFNSTNVKEDKQSAFSFNSFTVSDDSISKVDTPVTVPVTNNSAIYDPSLKKELNASKPEVLIYHTHTNENYNADCPDSLNEETNVVGVGDVLSQELEENYGISVIHDKTDHCISYNDSYSRSGETIDWYLNKYGDFKIILDIHRDSVNDKSATTTEINGESAAKIMFVNAKNSTRYPKNKELTEEVFNKTKELFPALPRKILTYNRGKNAFNQSKSDGCLLFEIGSHTNTPEEAKVTAQCMARVLAEILNR